MTNGSDRQATRPSVSAVVLAFTPRSELAVVLDRLESLPVHEVLVVENGPTEGLEEREDRVRVLRPGSNLGIAGRNLAAREATGDLLLMLDDDSYPLPGAVEALVEAFHADSRLAAAGGLVRDVDLATGVAHETGPGTFDWWLRAGRDGSIPAEGMRTFFFPEGACMIRRDAFLEVGGFFEPYFLTCVEIDLATRFLGAGWDVRYVPEARFEHLRAPAGREKGAMLRLRIRNQLWYFYRHFPATVAARRMPAYLLFDLIDSAKTGAVSSWAGGIADAWRDREAVSGTRRPLPRGVVRRAELARGRMHLRLLADRALRVVRR